MANHLVEELHDKLHEHLAALVTGDDWKAMLETAARFPSYSMRNVWLITMQRTDATYVAGYQAWSKLGRQVRRGEKGIRILAPCVGRREQPDGNGDDERVIRGFRVATVFDLSQTEGEELPLICSELLEGDAPHELWDALAAQVASRGFTVGRGDLASGNGRTDFGALSVTIAANLEPAQAFKTLAHELGHVACGHESRLTDDRSTLEVEAESVAYIVCASVGVTSDSYSFPYVANWARGDLDLVAQTGTRVVTAAKAILGELAETHPHLVRADPRQRQPVG